MEARRSPLLRSMRHFLTLAVVCLATTDMAAMTAYLSTTKQLDLCRVHLVMVAPTALEETLRNRTLTLFKSAGLPPPDSGSSQAPPLATLTLRINHGGHYLTLHDSNSCIR